MSNWAPLFLRTYVRDNQPSDGEEPPVENIVISVNTAPINNVSAVIIIATSYGYYAEFRSSVEQFSFLASRAQIAKNPGFWDIFTRGRFGFPLACYSRCESG